MEMKKEIKTCPVCKSDACLRFLQTWYSPDNKNLVLEKCKAQVVCKGCGLKTKLYAAAIKPDMTNEEIDADAYIKAVEAWNKRVEEVTPK